MLLENQFVALFIFPLHLIQHLLYTVTVICALLVLCVAKQLLIHLQSIFLFILCVFPELFILVCFYLYRYSSFNNKILFLLFACLINEQFCIDKIVIKCLSLFGDLQLKQMIPDIFYLDFERMEKYILKKKKKTQYKICQQIKFRHKCPTLLYLQQGWYLNFATISPEFHVPMSSKPEV